MSDEGGKSRRGEREGEEEEEGEMMLMFACYSRSNFPPGAH